MPNPKVRSPKKNFSPFTMNEHRLTFKKAISEALEEEMTHDKTIIVLGEDILDKDRVAVDFDAKKRFPERFIEGPLIEDMLGGVGLGLSLGGMKAIVRLDYETFITLAYDNLYRLGTWKYRTAVEENPAVTFRLGHCGYMNRGAELSASFLGSLIHLPNIWIATPHSAYTAKGLFSAALQAKRPVVYLEHKKLYEEDDVVPSDNFIVPFGTSTILRSGKDITIIAWSYMTRLVIEAAFKLSREGVDTEVIALHTLHPMDTDTIFSSVGKTKRVVIAEEDMLRGGVGAEIAARIAETLPETKIKRVAAKNVPLPGRKPFTDYILPNVEDIINACLDLLRHSK